MIRFLDTLGLTRRVARPVLGILMGTLFIFQSGQVRADDILFSPLNGLQGFKAPSQNMDCLDAQNKPLPIINDIVIGWQRTTPAKFLARARVRGTVIQEFPDHGGHEHFFMQIGKTLMETLEVVYNAEFGNLPNLKSGTQVEACGDYITAAQAPKSEQDIRKELDTPNYNHGSYTTSIIHWVHASTDENKHESGYVMIGGAPYGQQVTPGK